MRRLARHWGEQALALSEVEVLGQAERAGGLRANDVILAVGRVRITSVAEFRKSTEGLEAFVLQIRRGNAMLVIPIR